MITDEEIDRCAAETGFARVQAYRHLKQRRELERYGRQTHKRPG